MAVDYSKAPPNVVDLVKEVVDAHHPELRWVRIGVIMRDTAAVKAGRTVYGDARKVTAMQQVFMNYDFILCFAADAWRTLTALQREALVDHELCHCTVDEDEVASLVPHDIEMFEANFERYGFWWPRAEKTEQLFQARLGLTAETVGLVEAAALEKQVDVLEQVEGLFDMEDADEPDA